MNMSDSKHSFSPQTAWTIPTTGDRPHETTWELHRPFSEAELEEGIMSINPDTADVHWHHTDVFDPYGMGRCTAEQVGRCYFVRAPANNIWIAFCDLPDELRNTLWANWKAGLIPPQHLQDQKALRQLADEQLAATAVTLAAAWALCKDRAADQTGLNASFTAWLVEPLCKKHPNVDVEALVSVVSELLGPADSVRWFTSR
jgi:hypothetical protein